MLIESVVKAAQPYLTKVTIRDAVIGLSLVAVESDNGHIGISYVLREDLDPGCSSFPYAVSVIGQKAAFTAEWAVTGKDPLQKALGTAVITAASRLLKLEDSESPTRPFGVQFKKEDRVGMVGSIGPVVRMLKPMVREVYVFDKAISLSEHPLEDVMPMERQSEVLCDCDIMMISGTTFINGTIDNLLKLCEGAREIVIIGPSTPMFPEAFVNTRVSVLAGSWWKHENKELIFKQVSLAGGIPTLSHSAIKKTVKVSR